MQQRRSQTPQTQTPIHNRSVTAGQVDTVNRSFGFATLNPAAREDARQLAWQYLLTRRTDWSNPDRLRSQSRNAIADASRTIARQHARDTRTTVNYLQWEALESRSPLTALRADDEALCSASKLRVRARAIRNVRAYRSRLTPGAYRQLRRVACDLAATTGLAPSAATATQEHYDRQLQALLPSLQSIRSGLN